MVPVDTGTATQLSVSVRRGTEDTWDYMGDAIEGVRTIGAMRSRLLFSFTAAAVLLTGCAAGPAPRAASCFDLPGITESVAGDSVRSTAGVLMLRGTDLVLDDSGAEQVLLRDVQEWYAVENIDGNTVVVYSGSSDGESSSLISYDLTAKVMVELGVATTFEYAVTQVVYDRRSSAWIITAQSDLSETFSVVGADGSRSEEQIYAPYGYNAGPYLAAVIPGTGDGYLALEAPEGSSQRWSVATLDARGQITGRTAWPAALPEPEGGIDAPNGSGMYVKTREGFGAVVLNDTNGVRILQVCEAPRGRWLSRR